MDQTLDYLFRNLLWFSARALGIPTVSDRLIQKALMKVHTPTFDPGFSESSYAYRPKRITQQAVSAMNAHVTAGHRWAVDLDLEAFFDRVTHEPLMAQHSIIPDLAHDPRQYRHT